MYHACVFIQVPALVGAAKLCGASFLQCDSAANVSNSCSGVPSSRLVGLSGLTDTEHHLRVVLGLDQPAKQGHSTHGKLNIGKAETTDRT